MPKNQEKYKFFDNLGQLRYLSCLKSFDLMIGNSSSGLCEAPSAKIPVINIGDRQKGRFKPANVIEVGYSADEIAQGIKKALSQEFRATMPSVINPHDKYGDGKNSVRIKAKLKDLAINEDVIKKSFYDIDFTE